MTGPKNREFDERFEKDVQEEKEKEEKKYDTRRLHDEQASKEERNQSGNKSTEYDDDWS